MTLNEFTAKKLGEVLAFCQVGAETIERGREALVAEFGEQEITRLLNDLQHQAQTITDLAAGAGVAEITNTKAKGTGGKLRAMRDLYVGDQWDNATELMEWSGFFEGAAIVHWQLVIGVAEVEDNATLRELAQNGLQTHKNFLTQVESHIKQIGQAKAA